MATFNPEEFSVTYRQGATPTQPLLKRRYTLTYVSETDSLYLIIGSSFAKDVLNEQRNELFGEWVHYKDATALYLYVFIGDHRTDKSIQAIRYAIFNKEMPVLLTALRYGDHFFFKQVHNLDQAPIYVHYHSNYSEFHTIRYMQTPSTYETIKR